MQALERRVNQAIAIAYLTLRLAHDDRSQATLYRVSGHFSANHETAFHPPAQLMKSLADLAFDAFHTLHWQCHRKKSVQQMFAIRALTCQKVV